MNEPAPAGEASPRTVAEKKAQPPELVISTLRQKCLELQAENTALKSKNAESVQRYAAYYYDEFLPQKGALQIDAFKWQAGASEVLLWIVVAVCLAGIVFSGYQLWIATNRPMSPTSNASSGGGTRTTVKLSATEFNITSSVVGLIILVISLAYLYLFLKDVYNIRIESPVSAAAYAPAERSAGEQTKPSTPAPRE